MMRCPICGRFVGTGGPAWALKCACPVWAREAAQAGQAARPVAPVPFPCQTCLEDRRIDCAFSRAMPSCDSLAAWLAGVPMAAMVAAIRADKLVGRGTCSRIDECLEDADIRRELALAGCATVRDALAWAREDEALFLEQGLNQRWGEDDDGQLAAWRRFKAANGEDPPGAPARNDGLGLAWDD